MSGPIRLESKAAFLSQWFSKYQTVGPAKFLEAMLAWNRLPSHEKATYRIPEDTTWTESEPETLRCLWSSGALPEEVLAALPKRSYSAITQKAHREGIRRPDQYIKQVCRKNGSHVQ